jgi:DNA repair protein RecN (Recombination protein N)
MLRSLFIRNYALIDDLKVEFDSGLNILTGETGSGKSIILGALGLLIGDRADLSVLSDSEEKCIVEGEFTLSNKPAIQSFFDAHELDFEAQSFIRREILPSGRSRAFINDTPVKLNVLKELGILLIDIHSQHQTIQINNPEFQLSIYDHFTGNGKLVSDYRSEYERYTAMNRKLHSLNNEKAERINEEDYLRFQLQELNELDLDNIDEQDLEEEFNQLSYAEEIGRTLSETANYLGEGDMPAAELLKKAMSALSSIAEYSKGFRELEERVESCKIEIEDILSEVQSAYESVEVNPQRLQSLEETRNKLFRLEQKHQSQDLSELLEKKQEIMSSLNVSDELDDEIVELEAEISASKKELFKLAKELGKERRANIKRFSEKVLETLVQLNMKHAKFSVEIGDRESLGPNGLDNLEMKFSANPDRELKGLSNVASGGELSRLMLSLKRLAADSISSTLIFDEIDSGVSGEVAHSMGAIIKGLSDDIQTICITHLPQIASKGGAHFKVAKSIENGTTHTRIERLNEEERIVEIAQMLSGAKTTEAALANARDMLYLN